MEGRGSKAMKNGRRSNRERKIALLQDVCIYLNEILCILFLIYSFSFKVVMF